MIHPLFPHDRLSVLERIVGGKRQEKFFLVLSP
jgi:hypothetical protein